MIWSGIVQLVAFPAKLAIFIISIIIPRRNDLIICTAGPEGRFAENPKYVYLELVDDDRFDVQWLARDGETASQLKDNGLPVVTAGTFGGIMALLRAGTVIISHDYRWEYLGGATILQTHHGNPLKRIGRDLQDSVGWRYRFESMFLRNWDYLIVTGEAPTEAFKSAYAHSDNELLLTGYPRTDVLHRTIQYSHLDGTNDHSQWAEFFCENRIVLYMPTWRRGTYGADGLSLSNHGLDFDRIDKFCKRHSMEFVLKFHPSESMSVDTNEKIHELPSDTDVYDLLSNVDILVTDYSSVYFDFLLVDNPVVFYAYDLDPYRESRGFYFDYDDVTPGPTVQCMSDLLDSLEVAIEPGDEYSDHREEVRKRFYKYKDGKSTERVIEKINSCN